MAHIRKLGITVWYFGVYEGAWNKEHRRNPTSKKANMSIPQACHCSQAKPASTVAKASHAQPYPKP